MRRNSEGSNPIPGAARNALVDRRAGEDHAFFKHKLSLVHAVVKFRGDFVSVLPRRVVERHTDSLSLPLIIPHEPRLAEILSK